MGADRPQCSLYNVGCEHGANAHGVLSASVWPLGDVEENAVTVTMSEWSCSWGARMMRGWGVGGWEGGWVVSH